MKILNFAVVLAIFASANSAFAGLTTAKGSNCQAQASGTLTAKDKHQQAAEATRVFEGAAKPVPKSQPDAKAISEKGS